MEKSNKQLKITFQKFYFGIDYAKESSFTCKAHMMVMPSGEKKLIGIEKL